MTTREAIETQIIERAWHDPAFKGALLQDPKAAIAEAFGTAMPPDINLTVVAESPTHRYLVLPPAPVPTPLSELEVTDAELALIGGGRTFQPFGIMTSRSNTRSKPRRRRSC